MLILPIEKQPRRQLVVAPSELFNKSLSKALEKIYFDEVSHFKEYFDAGKKLGKF
jgi:hypothetical protein